MGLFKAWLDTGTLDDLLTAANFIATTEKRQCLKVNCPKEVTFRNGWITENRLREIAEPLHKIGSGEYLPNLIAVKSIVVKIIEHRVFGVEWGA